MAGPEGLTRDQSTFGRRDVIQALSSAATEGATVESIRSAAQAFLASPNAIPLLGSQARDGELRYSDPELLAIEGRVLLAAALTRSNADELAIDHLLRERDADRGFDRSL